MSFLTLSQAAKTTSKSKSTLNRAIKTGRLSATRNVDGTFSIDPSELARVFPQNAPERDSMPRPEQTSERNGAENLSKITLLEQLLEKEREALAREREVSADLKEDRDRWRSQATSLLSDLRTTQDKANFTTASKPSPSIQSNSFWKRIFGLTYK